MEVVRGSILKKPGSVYLFLRYELSLAGASSIAGLWASYVSDQAVSNAVLSELKSVEDLGRRKKSVGNTALAAVCTVGWKGSSRGVPGQLSGGLRLERLQ